MGTLVATALLAVSLHAAPGQNPAQKPTSSPGSAPSETTAVDQVSPDSIPVSYPRIRRALARKPLFQTPTIQEGTRFKVEIQQYQFPVADFASTLRFPKQPVAFGGLYHNELMNLMTPVSVRGSAPFSNGELLTVVATSFVQALAARAAVAGVRQIRESLKHAEEERIHRQVLRELLQIEENRKRREEEEKKKQEQ